MTEENYPLCWPAGRPRTPSHKLRTAVFKIKQDQAQREMVQEIQRLGGKNVIISTNIPIRRDGLPYADAARRRMDDAGVAVYFDFKGTRQCFCCDCYYTVGDNMRGIGKTIEALRGIERWGAGDMMERAFTGFAALPPPMVTPPPKKWWEVLDIGKDMAANSVECRYHALAKRHHPDAGEEPDGARMAEINAAYAEFKKERGL